MINEVQHKATITVNGRKVDIHAPPHASVQQIEAWLAETLRADGVELVSKSWSSPQ